MRSRDVVTKVLAIYLVRNGIIRVICEVGSRLIGAGVGRRALPPGDVNGVQVLGHHGDLDWV